MRAFSLVELSIVLVILGLLTGAVLTGQSLIRTAELRAVTSEAHRYVTATQTFRNRYMALPGDMKNATRFWGIAAGTEGNDNTCYETASSDTKTCDGNADGVINRSSNEIFRFWQHLANAGLIEGAYTGTRSNDSSLHTSSALNVPRSRLSGSLWFTIYLDGSFLHRFSGHYGHVLELGNPTKDDAPIAANLRPGELWNIDMKMDDGHPVTGNIVPRMRNGIQKCTTATSSTDKDAAYLLSSTSIDCSIIFRNVF